MALHQRAKGYNALRRTLQDWEKADIEDAEIHTIQEGLRQLADSNTTNIDIVLCVGNQNALPALPGGPTAGRKYVRASQEDVKVL